MGGEGRALSFVVGDEGFDIGEEGRAPRVITPRVAVGINAERIVIEEAAAFGFVFIFRVAEAKESGWLNTLLASASTVMGKRRITLEDIGVETLAKEFRDTEKLGKGLHAVLRTTGFEWVDKLGKLTLIEAKQRQIMRPAKKGAGRVDAHTRARAR